MNPWANANMVFVKYCSSDSWFGDAAAGPSTFGYAFRGSRIVSTVVAALVANNGLGSSGAAERLLFAGCSAGGRGALTNLDIVAAAVPVNVQVMGLLDAAAWVDVQPAIPGMLTLQQMTQDLYTFTTPPVPADCAATYTGASAWMCVWPSYRLPYITTPYFMTAAQFDAFQVRVRVRCNMRVLLTPSPPDHVRHQQPGEQCVLRDARGADVCAAVPDGDPGAV